MVELNTERYSYSVLKYVEELHMFCNGSKEPSYELPPNTEAKALACILQQRLDNWKPSQKTYNLLVKLLIQQVLYEFNKKI